MKDVRNIVVATDFSDIADHALDEAVELAEKFGAKITLVHSYEIPVYGFPDGILVASAEVTTQIQIASQKQLTEAIDRRKALSVPITPLLRMGAPWDEINAAAAETGAGLIVIGTHGRRGISRALLGSVAERVIRTATLPVLVVHKAAP
jgi:nucleotide-binding universal stress UspA family protein